MPLIIIASPQVLALLGAALFVAGTACYTAGREAGRSAAGHPQPPEKM